MYTANQFKYVQRSGVNTKMYFLHFCSFFGTRLTNNIANRRCAKFIVTSDFDELRWINWIQSGMIAVRDCDHDNFKADETTVLTQREEKTAAIGEGDVLLRRPNTAQIRHNVALVVVDCVFEGCCAIPATQRMSFERATGSAV